MRKSLIALSAAVLLAQASDAMTVTGPLPPPVTGQQKTTAASVQLPSAGSQNGWVIKASIKNSNPVMIGGSCPVAATNDGTGGGYPLSPGEAISFATFNLSTICIISANSSTTDFVSWAGN